MKKNKSSQYQSGFTLIELVIVIIILGVLAVTAAPKFINLQDDARKSAAQGVSAALQSAAQIIYSRASLEGIETISSATPLSGLPNVDIIYGYPTANTISNAVTLDGWEVSGSPTSSTVDFYPSNTKGNQCYVTYKQATSSDPFNVTLNGCE
ncbi:prepilin-type N-terminal cleavage/methylation domain-containing protein [Aeromonas hydrophila]|uniref:prepilin-type N-terminal cleavage/methylation domain-containing protein n=1 Tax=Aeromonas hydrophila TaxID=644 RepID=UPI00191E5A37|nr:prepilin-type N-terminal cleavage/methylation domain-containing protein [Aeromonas hydrophila]MBL0563662.1 prepilin-type N-terminal cleavage/methylation domain-containing protein [Aeromonas hydrophila]